jgi:CheY-like chemotaxis protein
VKGCAEKDPETIFCFPKLRVLCVDDNRDSADSTGILLDIYGCDVIVCYDAETAFTSALQFKPDVCLIDLNMPQRGGCDLARRLRAWSREHPLRLIAVTAYGSDETRRASFAAGFDLHFVIPVDWDELRDVLAEVGRRLGRALREE